ncbi:MAG: hypothetical protein HQ559_03595, partial [Lentisphaerae bacterium]|nr:hypothetical protein [Lentisphaerota bacterium]
MSVLFLAIGSPGGVLGAPARTADQVVVSLSESGGEMSIGRDSVGSAVFVGTSVGGEPGEPALPVRRIRLLLPPDADPRTVKAGIVDERTEELEATYEIEPVPPVAASRDPQRPIWPRGRMVIKGRDVETYATDSFLPASHVGRVLAGRLRGYRLAEIEIHPYRYNPVSKKLRQLVGGQLVVSFERKRSGRARSRRRTKRSDNIRDKLRSSVVNFGEYDGSYEAPDIQLFDGVGGDNPAASSSGGYVILTTSAIQGGSTELANFVAAKEAQGFSVDVVTESTWGAGTGNTAAENIRVWLAENYVSMGIEYVLLIGNANPSSGDVPMKMVYPQSYDLGNDRCPTDYYYAELTGDWDLDNDGKYGEYSGDYGPGGAERNCEVIVGRIPYYGNNSDLDAILAKIVGYGREAQGTAAWRKNVLLPMEPSDGSTPGYQLGEEIKNSVLVPKGDWACHRVYNLTYGLNPAPETYPCSVANVRGAWNSGDFGAVFWWTHGSATGASDVMDLSSAATLDDTHPAFTFQCSCNNSYPENSSNLSYAILKNGGICTISGSRVTWYWIGQTSFAGQSSNSSMTYEYAKRLIGDELPAGDALQDMKQDIAPEHQVMWMNHLGFNLYGDPSVGLYTYVIVNAPTGLTTHAFSSDTVQLFWTDNAANEDGFVVHRIEGDQLAEVLDESGLGNHGVLDPDVPDGPSWVLESGDGCYEFGGLD